MSRGQRRPALLRRSGPIDWQAVRERIARAQDAAGVAGSLSPEQARAVLDERARLLARPTAETAPASGALELLTFTLARERYAVELRYVRDLLRFEDFTPVPGAPEFIVGVVHARGEIVAAVELGRFFGLPPRGVTDLSRLLVLGEDSAELGILADQAHDIVYVPASEILDPSATVTGIGKKYLRGITSQALIVLDGAALLQDELLFVGARGDAREEIEVGR